ncbi:uncharacterized protein LOC135688222 [Rhopilema esculentum]|uniref:uncharacterized protein LOC135688222 n=1 Tax=Rhopilema esculentum TaxID=499914 RepID=UPI0031CE153B|eukprot:gene7175-12841_t
MDLHDGMGDMQVCSFPECNLLADSKIESTTDKQNQAEECKAKRTRRLFSSASSIDSGIFISPYLDKILNDSEIQSTEEIIIENCHWSTEEADLILDLEGLLFPVKRMLLWENSGFFKAILANVSLLDDDTFQVLKVKGINPHDMEDILRYFHDEYLDIPEIEVLDVLKVAYKLDCTKLVARCETVLLNAVDVHPLDLLDISKKYNLETLKAKAICQASLEPKITCYQEFESLDNNVQAAIIRRLVANLATQFKGV